ncbi:hypothetical protein RHGRI_022276 [Rhododendron griersonianum]|uniref:Uncharacterized protein n=1 Tax=Rhododendron griersonianum TaxID=479676 RepID=A0AAV6J1D9_9ERIC|nr:hypothetical protein RHGRI_022276 [Rhododendron griersonianum]
MKRNTPTISTVDIDRLSLSLLLPVAALPFLSPQSNPLHRRLISSPPLVYCWSTAAAYFDRVDED